MNERSIFSIKHCIYSEDISITKSLSTINCIQTFLGDIVNRVCKQVTNKDNKLVTEKLTK